MTAASILESVKSFAVSSALTVQSVAVAMFTIGYTDGSCSTLSDTLKYFSSHWWAGAAGVFLGVGPYYRARQGAASLNSSTSTLSITEHNP